MIFMKAEDIVLIILVAVAVILILWYLFGQSPTLEQITIGLIVANLGFTFKMWGDLQKHIGKHEGSEK